MFQSIHGDDVKILKQGVRDNDAGVYRHAELEINGHLVIGDVIHSDTIQAYYNTKMHLNSRFNRAILHVASRDVFSNLRIRLENGKVITTVISCEVMSWIF